MENDYQKETEKIEIIIKDIEKKLEEMRSEELSDHYSPLVAFYTWARSYLDLRKKYWVSILKYSQNKLLTFYVSLLFLIYLYV